MEKLVTLNKVELINVVGGKPKKRHPKACSWTFTGAGIGQSTIYSAAALGVSGPAGWIPGALVGAAYGITGPAFC